MVDFSSIRGCAPLSDSSQLSTDGKRAKLARTNSDDAQPLMYEDYNNYLADLHSTKCSDFKIILVLSNV